MSIKRAFDIVGIGKYLPETIITSSHIEEELNLPEHWICENIGVETRHRANHEESNSYMGAEALKAALRNAHLNIKNIDYLISASATFDYVIPNRSCLIKSEFKNAEQLNFPCIDINSVCTSFISALDYASYLLSQESINNIAIVSSEISSNGLDPSNQEAYSLFGDGAAAVIISSANSSGGLIKHLSQTYTSNVMSTKIIAGGNKNHPRSTPYDAGLYSFQMEGPTLLKSVMSILPSFLQSFFDNTDTNLEEINLIIPHQASKMGLKMLHRLNQNNSSNVANYLKTMGNCIASSIPLALAKSIEEGKLKSGDRCFLIGTAAGLTISGLLFEYNDGTS